MATQYERQIRFNYPNKITLAVRNETHGVHLGVTMCGELYDQWFADIGHHRPESAGGDHSDACDCWLMGRCRPNMSASLGDEYLMHFKSCNAAGKFDDIFYRLERELEQLTNEQHD